MQEYIIIIYKKWVGPDFPIYLQENIDEIYNKVQKCLYIAQK